MTTFKTKRRLTIKKKENAPINHPKKGFEVAESTNNP